ncbi:nicotinate-nucleotide adenylyltransferase [Pseudoruegeria sp. HB172150]|uniref:nicotinate-nucleotide adenylyltransferase n=1 Tax=Pseudoruegeria sp. HB172150 TaxID=2721164 RepID=UPI001554B557|nr:nicotinate-nucleotide adenylyltransferase [Pseudoruegeria sp. HB172150]
MRCELPVAAAGQTVGLLGGSFDPPHEGHVRITREALRRFGLDRIWWLVSPGNPLKSQGPAPMDRRMGAAQEMMRHPRVTVTDIEARIGTRYTAQTIAKLQHLYPGVRFVWLMGADNLATFHHWDRWQEIFETVPIGVLARPGGHVSARCSVAAERYGKFLLRGRKGRLLPRKKAPCWCFLNVPMVNLSSTEIRARGDWVR